MLTAGEGESERVVEGGGEEDEEGREGDGKDGGCLLSYVFVSCRTPLHLATSHASSKVHTHTCKFMIIICVDLDLDVFWMCVLCVVIFYSVCLHCFAS